MFEKDKKTEILLNKIKKLSRKYIDGENYEKALALLAFIGDYLYEYNQFYTENDLETYLSEISDKLKEVYHIRNQFATADTVLFYDGFGLDTRGVALMYLNALGLGGYHVIYVTNESQRELIPTVTAMCNKYQFEMQFINMSSYLSWTKQLAERFLSSKPRAAFFYTTPNDVSGISAFHMFEGTVDRYLIDLTDHAFWLGKSAVDYFLGSRNMSASLQHFERGIEKSKMIKLGVNLLVDPVDDHSELPFDPENTRYIFSGGALYKTLGDPDNYFYKIVDHLLTSNQEIRFLYAGSGDDTELSKLILKYPDRVFHISERRDFYYLIQNCVLYLNTYPMFGGMMMKYCGLAHKIPVTLKHGHDSDGLLLHQAECQIEYDSYDELVEDVDKLLSDSAYLQRREMLLEGSVISEERFKNNVCGVIENHKTDYEHEFEVLDTTAFRKEYYERFDYEKQMLAIAKKINLSLFSVFPVYFIRGLTKKILKKLTEKKKNND